MDLSAAANYISLFSGGGGLDLSIRLAMPRAKCSCYVEIDVPAAAILATRLAEGSLDDAPIWSDIRTFDGRPWRGLVDGIIGGFPCTDLSVAGKQEGIIEGNRSGLFFEYVRIIREVQPGWALLENVPPVLAFPNGGIVLGELNALGFDAEWMSLRASDVGAPHQRKRVFILAHDPNARGRGISEPDGRNHATDIDGDCAELAHTLDGGSQNRRTERSIEVRDGRDDVDNSADSRLSGWKPGESSAPRDGARLRESGRRCDAVADSGYRDGDSRRPDESLRSGFESGRHAGDDSAEPLADPGDGLIQEQGRGTQRRDGTGSASADVMDDSSQPRLQRRELGTPLHGNGNRTEAHGSAIEPSGLRVGLFPPGPSDRDAWATILCDHPELAPAISEEEAQSFFRRVDDGLAEKLDEFSRVDRLRACGNGVVSLCGAMAFTLLARRTGGAQ